MNTAEERGPRCRDHLFPFSASESPPVQRAIGGDRRTDSRLTSRQAFLDPILYGHPTGSVCFDVRLYPTGTESELTGWVTGGVTDWSNVTELVMYTGSRRWTIIFEGKVR